MAEKEEESVTVEMLPEGKQMFELGISSIIGTRSSQQDSVFGYADREQAIAVVCDGMGGLAGGEMASQTAVESLASAWFSKEEISDIPAFLEQEARNADQKIFLQKDENGARMEAGSTIVAVVAKRNELYWLSVGDSRIYMIRGGEILAVNRDHNYRMTLDQKLMQGEITQEEYAAEEYRAEALISYLGMGNVSLMDINQQPFWLEEGDIVILSSDGLYRSLSEKEILAAVEQNKADMQTVAEVLTEKALECRQSGQDNTSVAVLRFCEETESI